jgi:hypothetical protein
LQVGDRFFHHFVETQRDLQYFLPVFALQFGDGEERIDHPR